MTWYDDVTDHQRQVQIQLFSLAEFTAAIGTLIDRRDGPLTGFRAEFRGRSPMTPVRIGSPGLGTPDATETLNLNNGFTVWCEIWWSEHSASEDRDKARRAMNSLLTAWWNPDGRNEKSLLLTTQSPPIQRALEETFTRWTEHAQITFCAADIDNFKNYNDTLSLAAGDDLIARLGMKLQSLAPPDYLVIHRSGDEFILLLPPRVTPGAAVASLIELRAAVEQSIQAGVREEATHTGVNVTPLPGLSMGVTTCDNSTTLTKSEDAAGRALKPDGNKRRGRVSIAPPPSSPTVPEPGPVIVGLVLALTRLGSPEPFQDPVLDAASLIAFELAVRADIDSATFTEEYNEQLPSLNDSAEPQPDKFLVAAIHGVGRAIVSGQAADTLGDLTIHFADQRPAIEIGTTWMPVNATPAPEMRLHLRRPPAKQLRIDNTRAILVTIGADLLGLPPELFASMVYVDDRPTIGGGLPDFWQAALAQIVNALQQHPNVSRIFIAGDISNGKQTVARLRLSDQWTKPEVAEEMAHRLGLQSMTRIVDAGERIGDRVSTVTTPKDLVLVMLKDLFAEPAMRPVPDADPIPRPPRLRRVIDIEEMLPGKGFGFTSKTAADAFPVALDIVRDPAGKQLLLDQSRREFRELVDFRIQLTTPQVDPVPRFYTQDQALLDEYFQREFMQPGGLFREKLQEHDQLQAVISHVADVLDTQTTTSRRGLLVIPHVPNPEQPLSPLGLVSIRLIPRPMIRRVQLDYSFTWRTVEALVGLPYSLFGSIRFAQHLTDAVRARTETVVSMGQLSYICHSLHMFADEYAEQVARHIINDETL